ncbi:MAG: TadE family protein [Pseudomonadota bacterium]
MSFFLRKVCRFRQRDDGNATIEFVFLFPLFMAIFLMGFEAGFYMVRSVMLERAVDIAARDIRLGNGNVPDFDAVRDNICENAFAIYECTNSVHVYMEEVQIAPGAIAAVTGDARCINRRSNVPQYLPGDYNVGNTNTMMVVQVCATVTPMFPTTGIGLGLQIDDLNGDTAIVTSTAFVNEPGNRAFAAPPTTTGGGGGSGDGSAGDGTTDPDSST